MVVEANNRISQSNAIVFSADEKIALVPKVILTRIDEKDNDNDINNGKKVTKISVCVNFIIL